MATKTSSKKKRTKLANPLSNEASFFLEPTIPKQRQYEALRAYFVDHHPVKEVSEQFGYTSGAFHTLCYEFRRDPEKAFFIATHPGPKHTPKRDRSRQLVIELRKQNYSVEDIQYFLREQGTEISTVSIWLILQEEGFSRLPRRREEERPSRPKPQQAPYADVRHLSLQPRTCETKLGGLFLLLKIVAGMQVPTLAKFLGWYGSKMIPTENALLSCLLLKLIGKERKNHVMDLVFDEGAALAVGLNVLPKTSYVAEYSERITHEDNLKFMQRWLGQLRKCELITGESINLDFQSLPYYGQEDVVEKHYVSMRSRRQKAILVFFAQDARSKIFCYSNADLRKGEEAEEVFGFIDFWKKQTGKNPPHLVFDSQLTTYANLSKLNKMGVRFLTLRRRSPGLIKEITNTPRSAWRKITLPNVARKYRTPKVLEKQIQLKSYEGGLRQVIVTDLGHDTPTVLITNDYTTSIPDLITRYALRMLVENTIATGVDFFHTRALSSSVAIRIDFDVLLTLIAQATYHILAKQLRGYEHSQPDLLFRKFIDTPAKILIGSHQIEVRLAKRAHNPILLHSGLLNSPFKLPWIKRKTVVVTLR